MTRRSAHAVAALAALAASACVSVRPYSEVAASLPPESLIDLDGQRVHVVDRGAGEPLVLLHGFGASTLIWEPAIPELARSRRVIAIDLNGFGWTERPRERDAYTLAGQVRLVLGVADALGVERFDLAGHSYGGAISLVLATRHPERVRSLVLVDAAMPTYDRARRRQRFASRRVAGLYVNTVGVRAGRVRRGLREVYADDSKVTEELVRAYLERLRVEGLEDAFYGLSAPTEAPYEEVELAAVGPPVLLVWGAEDVVTRPADGRRAAAAMPRAEFVALPGCGHSPQEECPRAFVAAVAPFLAARP